VHLVAEVTFCTRNSPTSSNPFNANALRPSRGLHVALISNAILPTTEVKHMEIDINDRAPEFKAASPTASGLSATTR
jgi:hypothetical protein